MPELLPLAGASRRLRKPAGRPRKARPAPSTVVAQASAPSPAPPDTRGSRPAVAEVWPIGPRLLDVEASAAYLGGVSVWTIRSYIAEGVLVPVVLPGSSGALRRVLLDRVDLDQLVEQGKGGAEAGRKGAG